MDRSQVTVDTFDRYAERYAEKFLKLDAYDRFYRQFCRHLPRHATMLDVACGPGNVAAFVARERPDVQLLGRLPRARLQAPVRAGARLRRPRLPLHDNRP